MRRHASVSHLKSIISWSGLCVHVCVKKNARPFSRYKCFQFSYKDTSTLNCNLSSVLVQVWLESGDNWASICLWHNANRTGFFGSVPNLWRAPPTATSLPSGKSNIKKPFETVGRRITSTARVENLYKREDYIFKTKTGLPYWSLATNVETFSNV